MKKVYFYQIRESLDEGAYREFIDYDHYPNKTEAEKHLAKNRENFLDDTKVVKKWVDASIAHCKDFIEYSHDVV